MNSVALTGRFTRDPDVRYTDNGLSIARFTIAVDRRFKRENEATADFIRCVAFGKTAEFIEKHFQKGMKIEVNGRIQTGSYKNQDGDTVYTTDVIVESCDFGESRRSQEQSNPDGDRHSPAGEDGFMYIPDGIDEEVPFN